MHDFKQHLDEAVRESESRAVAAIAARYLVEHGDALAERFGAWEATVAVPSTHHSGEPALQVAIEANFPAAFAPFARPLVQGPGNMGFNRANETGFLADEDVAGKSYLLVDDTFTTGARIHSAHHALVAAGAAVPAAIVVTRKINPSPEYGTLKLWNRQSQIEFSFDSPPWWRSRQTEIEAVSQP